MKGKFQIDRQDEDESIERITQNWLYRDMAPFCIYTILQCAPLQCCARRVGHQLVYLGGDAHGHVVASS